ncbi:hypothetical protein CN285_27305 [Bacillus cereus]|uniref:DUF1036 domain-containing protein n=1 Tax=Bacillus paramycoides TaxID=2026194 RepID=UPI000BF409EC|nr:DUF1036 domain-containing protein [Bacillus paramycoides]MED0962362.1 DUF1036 domain-containing protein [Bacillus paramycoides]PFD32666.1 hypothetical protein CN285_27305 [Bacillus cereus]
MYEKLTRPILYNSLYSLLYPSQYWGRLDCSPPSGLVHINPGNVMKRSLYFHNKTNATLWVVYADYEPNCEGLVQWKKHGWYKVDPGKKVKVTMNVLNVSWDGIPLMNHEFLYYAEDDIGHVWSGECFTQIPDNSFHWCWNTGSTNSKTLGLQKKIISPSDKSYTQGLIL